MFLFMGKVTSIKCCRSTLKTSDNTALQKEKPWAIKITKPEIGITFQDIIDVNEDYVIVEIASLACEKKTLPITKHLIVGTNSYIVGNIKFAYCYRNISGTGTD